MTKFNESNKYIISNVRTFCLVLTLCLNILCVCAVVISFSSYCCRHMNFSLTCQSAVHLMKVDFTDKFLWVVQKPPNSWLESLTTHNIVCRNLKLWIQCSITRQKTTLSISFHNTIVDICVQVM